MAVRRQLREFYRGSQPSGVITVERSSPPRDPAWSLPSSPSSSPSSPPSSPPLSGSACDMQLSPSSTPAAEAASPPRWQGPQPEDCAVFHCCGCWTVLGDSIHLCVQEKRRLGVLICFKVTNDVVWEDSLMVGLEGALLGCAYSPLFCRSCGLIVGFTLYSAPSDLAHLRGSFCFFEDRILCYLLQGQMIIAASKVKFPTVNLHERVQKLKEKLVKFYYRIEFLMKQLEELERIFISDAVCLPPGYAIVRVN